MYNIYFYPKIDYTTANSPNPYISDFEFAIGKRNTIVNNKFNSTGVLNFFKYLFKSDIFIFNWIENLGDRRFGKIQIFAFSIFLFCAKYLNKKIIWVLHNKYSHYKKRSRWTDLLMKIMVRNSDLIITHSTAGIDFVTEKYPGYELKVKYYIHPVKEIMPKKEELNRKKFDFLIWGTIFPYKGVLEFLKFIREHNSASKILILGKCFDSEYKKQLQGYMSKNIVFYDQIFSIEEIAQFARQSQFTLFTYKPHSVLSSGALMDSIRMRTIIIGPNHGAFEDLNSFSFIRTFKNYEDILIISENYKPHSDQVNDDLEDFCKKNSWKIFAENLENELAKL